MSEQAVETVLDSHASDLAFRMGQAMQKALIHRAIALARQGNIANNEVHVTSEHVTAVLDESILAEIRQCLREFADESRRRERISA